MTERDYVSEADRTLEETYEEPMSLATYVDRVFENPTIASHASKYLLEAIEVLEFAGAEVARSELEG